MMLITAVRVVQIPLLSAMLLGGCTAKLTRTLRLGSVDAGLGPTALFPMRLRRPAAMTVCTIEFGLGAGLIVTAGHVGAGWPANSVRLGTGVLFLVATCALLELRDTRPDVGCGCFGEFSSAPVSARTIARAALLAVAAFATIDMPPLRVPDRGSALALLLGILAAELAVLGALSPELGEALVRLGYSEPCELRVLAEDRTLSSLRRSAQWRKHAGEITAAAPVDMWRELCWRYVAFASRVDGRETEIVFAVYLRPRRPPVHSALTDAATSEVIPWPAPLVRPAWPLRLARQARQAGLARLARLSGPHSLTSAGLPAPSGQPGRPGPSGQHGSTAIRPAVKRAAAELTPGLEPLLAAPTEPVFPDLSMLPAPPMPTHPLGSGGSAGSARSGRTGDMQLSKDI